MYHVCSTPHIRFTLLTCYLRARYIEAQTQTVGSTLTGCQLNLYVSPQYPLVRQFLTIRRILDEPILDEAPFHTLCSPASAAPLRLGA